MRERNEELKEKILNGETEESVAIGAGSYTKSEWSKFLKDFDDAQDMIKQQIREEITKRVEKQEKIEEIEDEKFFLLFRKKLKKLKMKNLRKI